ncbi:major facilitator superfamily domain-containing protein 6-like [Centruroides sculpturatus]|uniref:major facilitator superfamily domain-containing protein 6-like n=1 Tax=Centruroides sculpturatus TaxID=218467 RepID=UPI000C6EA10D|nr:major facilitator superfamily domain-containing protein 6-like [Centruroides sculpturatus]
MDQSEMKNEQEDDDKQPNTYHQERNLNEDKKQFTGKGDVIDNLLTAVNQDLLVSKLFYFFFFSAFGSLFPLLGVYFKQLGMNPEQSGMLIGFRPFVEFLSAPLWGNVADRFRKGKTMLLFSLGCWIIFTLALNFIQPPASSCMMSNATHNVYYEPDAERDKRSIETYNDLSNVSLPILYETENEIDKKYDLNSKDTVVQNGSTYQIPYDPEEERNKRNVDAQINIHNKPIDLLIRYKRVVREANDQLPVRFVVGKSPQTVDYTSNANTDKDNSYVSPPFSSMVYKREDVQEVFFLLLLLIVLGEFFSAPAITLADSATLCFLGENIDNYGKQRMFGSLGWGLAMFFVGIALDQSKVFPYHPCEPHGRERNYTICFATFSVLMGCAFISATQFRFDYESVEENIPMGAVKTQIATNEPIKTEDGTAPAKSEVFAQTTQHLSEWLDVLRTFATIRYAAFLYVTWFMGFGIGLVFTFLFWHLQDLGGTPTLFGVASVINHVSEIFAYFFSFKFIKQIGHTKVLCIGLFGNICRFLYISWLTDPWWVLPFEFIQGITHAAVWAACCSYITQATPSKLRSSAQGVLQGIHHGLGKGCGAIIGGLFVNSFGTRVTFRGYGFACLIVLFLFILINYYRRDKGFTSFQDEHEPDTILEETSHLAPHGVPANPMAKSLSRQNMQEKSQDIYEYQSTGNSLSVPGGTTSAPAPTNNGGQAGNPFLDSQYHIVNQNYQNLPEQDTQYVVTSVPQPDTQPYTPQPDNRRNQTGYDW